MITSFENRFSCFIEDDFFTGTAAFLDTKSYVVNEDCEELFEKSVPIIVSRYSQQLVASNCNVDCLKAEFRVMFTHVRKFLSGNSPSRCWPQLFQLKSGLGLKNILHIAEICIVVPLSNAESERIFSYLWRQLSKERMSLNHQTLERVLQLRSASKGYRIETYDHAIDLFLTEFPNGTVRKRHVTLMVTITTKNEM